MGRRRLLTLNGSRSSRSAWSGGGFFDIDIGDNSVGSVFLSDGVVDIGLCAGLLMVIGTRGSIGTSVCEGGVGVFCNSGGDIGCEVDGDLCGGGDGCVGGGF